MQHPPAAQLRPQPPAGNLIGIDVTGMSDAQIDRMEQSGHVDGTEINGVLFPSAFQQSATKGPTTRVKDTKHNQELFGIYGAKAFLKDGSINYNALSDKHVIEELRRYPGVTGAGKSARPNCWKVIKQLSKARIPRLVDKISATTLQKKTQMMLEKQITAFVKCGTPEAVERERRRLEKKRKEKKAERLLKKTERAITTPKKAKIAEVAPPVDVEVV